MRMTDQRRVIAQVLSASDDHPDVEELHHRAAAVDPRISIATVYRTVRMFEENGILSRLDLGDGRARYEEMPESHHDHLIDTRSGKIIEFNDPEIEALRSEEHTSELQSLMRISYAVFCLKKKKKRIKHIP